MTAPDATFPDALAAASDRLAALAALGAARTVAVHGRDGRRPRSGILWADGLVVTAEEALERDDDLLVTLPEGRRVPATLAGRDPGQTWRCCG
jgi:S1-C subfamily serine protease